MTAVALLYSPTPMKRRTQKRLTAPRCRPSESVAGGAPNNSTLTKFIKGKDYDEVDCSKNSNQDSLSSKLGSTVATAEIESDSDSDCDASFFCERISESASVTESQAEEESVKQPEDDRSKASTKKKKKKKKKTERSEKTPKKKKKKREKTSEKIDEKSIKTEKSEKKKKKREKSGKKKRKSSSKTGSKCAKKEISKERSLFDALQDTAVKAMEQSHSDSDDSWESNYVVPQIQKQEVIQQLPYGPPLWGDKEEENDFSDVWEEDKSWNGWDETKDAGEECEESLCDDGSHDGSHDGFSYYTVQSNDDYFGFPEDDDIENVTVEDWDEKSASENPESVGIEESETRKVCFSEHDIVHSTLHICDFTRGEINRSWYQQNDYEETIQDVKEVASNSESPRDSQSRRRKQRSLLSKPPDTRGLEAWTPSGVQRFRYVKEAAFRAVWDEQQKQLDRLDEHDDDDNTVDLSENVETLRESYQRVSMRSQKEAQERGKRDEEIAEKLRPRLGLKRGGSRRELSRFKKSIGSSSRKLLDGNSSHDLSDSPAALQSCLRKTDPIDENVSEESSEETNKRVWFRDPSRKSSREKLESPRSERGLFKQSSDRSLFKKKPDRGLFKQSSDRSLFKSRSRGLFKQASDRSIFKKTSNFGPIREEEEESPQDMMGSLFGNKQTRRSSDGMLSSLRSDRRTMMGLSRRNSESVLGEKVDEDCQ